jgi:drug/metabolite transporter (DMT)-like permease
MFVGSLILFAAIIAWGTSLWMSPHTPETTAGVEHVRTTVVVFVRNSAVGTLVLSALAAWLLFPARRPHTPRRDWAIIATIAVMVLTSVYQLIWLRSVIH